jgi:hypothetical protein
MTRARFKSVTAAFNCFQTARPNATGPSIIRQVVSYSYLYRKDQQRETCFKKVFHSKCPYFQFL